MARITFYKNFLNCETHEKIYKKFTDTILLTNRTYDFFVDWKKVFNNVKKYKVEIGILSALVGSKSFDKDFKSIVWKYPEVIKVLPLIIAVRDERFDVLEDLDRGDIFSFNLDKELCEESIEELIIFVKKSGIENLFKSVRILHDYLLGVEVGLDSNARKNRSGTFMEEIVGRFLIDINKSVKNLEVFPKDKFSVLSEKYKIKVPAELKARTPDFSLRKESKLISLEVNFYQGQGSKPQEIVDAYINRQKELKSSGWEFIWITDGEGWRKGQNQINKAIEQIDFVLNIDFIKNGFLKYIIENI